MYCVLCIVYSFSGPHHAYTEESRKKRGSTLRTESPKWWTAVNRVPQRKILAGQNLYKPIVIGLYGMNARGRLTVSPASQSHVRHSSEGDSTTCDVLPNGSTSSSTWLSDATCATGEGAEEVTPGTGTSYSIAGEGAEYVTPSASATCSPTGGGAAKMAASAVATYSITGDAVSWATSRCVIHVFSHRRWWCVGDTRCRCHVFDARLHARSLALVPHG